MTVFKEKDLENLEKWGNEKANEFWMGGWSKALYQLPD